jgi:DMSO/TMAO reductase YedYZ molybdopterin-dependent catalytic subunit
MLFGSDGGRRELQEQMRAAGRLPPNQSLTLKWPVLHQGSVPRFDAARWDFRVFGLVANTVKLSWNEFNGLPQTEVLADMHCVTHWSRFDNHWQGVAASDAVKLANPLPAARYALIHAEQGYTANLPLADLVRPTSLFALRHDGEPLTGDHGFPLRLVVPHLYAWKSVKWVRGVELLEKEQPGFWEENGYHIYGDPFREERYSS